MPLSVSSLHDSWAGSACKLSYCPICIILGLIIVIVLLPVFNHNLSLTSHSLKVRGHIELCFCLIYTLLGLIIINVFLPVFSYNSASPSTASR
jgi:hypothetical protein